MDKKGDFLQLDASYTDFINASSFDVLLIFWYEELDTDTIGPILDGEVLEISRHSSYDDFSDIESIFLRFDT